MEIQIKMFNKNMLKKGLIIGLTLLIFSHCFLSFNYTYALPQEDFRVSIGDQFGFNITDHWIPDMENATIRIEVLNINYSNQPDGFNANGSTIWVNSKSYNNTGILEYDLSNWTVLYNDSDPTLSFFNGCVTNPHFEDGLFVAPSNLTAWLYFIELIFTNNLPFNVTELNSTSATGWTGFVNGSGVNSSSQKWILNYNATDSVLVRQQIFQWDNVSKIWVMGLNAERYLTIPAQEEPELSQLNPIVLIGLSIFAFFGIIIFIYFISKEHDGGFQWL